LVPAARLGFGPDLSERNWEAAGIIAAAFGGGGFDLNCWQVYGTGSCGVATAR